MSEKGAENTGQRLGAPLAYDVAGTIRRRAIALAVGLLPLVAFAAMSVPFNPTWFCDESDNLLAGWLTAQGRVAYRDFFSQHVPFVYLFSGLTHLFFGRNWVIQRLILAAFGLTNLTIITARLKRKGDPRLMWGTALFTLLWPSYSVLYWGYMVLNDNYAAFACLYVFVLLVHCLWDQTELTRLEEVWLGVNGFAAVFSNPHTVFTLGAAVPFFLYVLVRRGRLRGAVGATVAKGVCWSGAGFFAPTLLMVFYFLRNNALGAAYEYVIPFNVHVYAKYAGPTTEFWRFPLHQIRTLFDLLQPWRWHFETNPRVPAPPWGDDSWAYLGFAGRAAILLLSLWCLSKRRPAAGLFLFLFGVFSTVRCDGSFHAQHFRMVQVFCSCTVLATAIGAAGRMHRVARALPLAVAGLLIFSHAMVVAKSVRVERRQHLRLTLHAPLIHPQLVEQARRYLGPDGKALAWPTECHFHYESGYMPAGYFYFYFPWIADRPQDVERAVSDLTAAAKEDVLVTFDPSAEVSGLPMGAWAKDAEAVLQTQFFEVERHLFLSKGAKYLVK
jgi:hypothetical protein